MHDVTKFKRVVWQHYRQNKRELPWRRTTNPYRIFISEVMLQQTQVSRVVPKYREFIKAFPNFKKLAEAKLSEVLEVWSGLGYNRRALYLHRAAQKITNDYNEKLPNSLEALESLPGIGSHTAGSIAAFAFNSPVVFIETNIRSVYLHHFFPGKKQVSDKQLLQLIEKTLDKKNAREWYWALMDYGNYLKKTHPNPSRASKHHIVQAKFSGSNRQLRGQLLRLGLASAKLSKDQLYRELSFDKKQIDEALFQLDSEQLLKVQGDTIHLR